MKLVLIIFSFFLISCASSYKGAAPNFELSGESAQLEKEKFNLNTNYLSQNFFGLKMGPKNKNYTEESLRPIMSDVSPESIEQLNIAKRWSRVGLISSGVLLGMIVYALADDRDNFKDNKFKVLYWGAFGVNLAGLQISYFYKTKAAQKFNSDLNNKFSPRMSYRFSF